LCHVDAVQVQFHRAWSSDGDAPAAAVDTSLSASSDGGELSPGTCPRPAADPGPGSGGQGSGAAARRLAYEQFARVMYTNRANLEHTIAVQQRLFQQQLARPAAQPPPLPPRPAAQVNGGGERSDGTAQLEWVVRRRADGTRYITRRPARPHRSRRPARDVTSSPADRKEDAAPSAAGKTETKNTPKEGSRRKEVATAIDVAPERTKEQSLNSVKSVAAFHSAPVTSLRQANQHPILAVITI